MTKKRALLNFVAQSVRKNRDLPNFETQVRYEKIDGSPSTLATVASDCCRTKMGVTICVWCLTYRFLVFVSVNTHVTLLQSSCTVTCLIGLSCKSTSPWRLASLALRKLLAFLISLVCGCIAFNFYRTFRVFHKCHLPCRDILKREALDNTVQRVGESWCAWVWVKGVKSNLSLVGLT